MPGRIVRRTGGIWSMAVVLLLTPGTVSPPHRLPQQLAWSLNPSSASEAAVLGTLRFDPAKLRYVGQRVDTLTLLTTNSSREQEGILRLLVLNVRGIPTNEAVLVFEQLTAGARPPISFVVEEEVRVGRGSAVTPAQDALRPVSLAIVPAGIRRMSGREWTAYMDSTAAKGTTPVNNSRPGGPKALKLGDRLPRAAAYTIYGDANGNGTVTGGDAVLVSNMAVGNFAAPAAGTAQEVAANVAPNNLPGLGGPADSASPGWTTTCQRGITGADATVISNEAVGNDNPVAGELIPAGSIIPVGCLTSPLDPVYSAPPIDTTAPSSLGQTAAFLYTGPYAVQTNVTPGSIDPLRTAVIRGRTLDTAGVALGSVQVAVLDHPEWGRTYSRFDGWYDFVYNGGGPIIVSFTKTGLLPVQRPLMLSWEQRGLVDTVVMTPLDPQTTNITFAAAIEVARGTVVSDSLGARQATVMFRQGTTATMRLPNGTTQPLTTLTVRATEYTVGVLGPLRMPGTLPPTSMFTYAVDISVDQATAAGATRVDFSKTFAFYVENVLNLPTGTRVPVGTYDGMAGRWLPEADGRVLRVLSTSPVQVAVSYTDSTTPASQVQLDSLGITAAELTQLGALYTAGKRLWRVQLNHLTPADLNFPVALPNKASGPLATLIRALFNRNCKIPGSVISCESQTLGEDIGITGTPFTLHYQSDRSPGFMVDRQVVIPPQQKRDSSTITSAAPIKRNQFPSHVFDVSYRLEVAGRTIEYLTPVGSLTTIPGQTLTWDGKDVYNRTINGAVPARVTLGYSFANSYAVATAGGGGGSGFGAPPGAQVITRASRTRIELGQVWEGTLGTWDANAGLTLGGWSFSPHHVYDPTSRTLWLGSGDRRQAEPQGNVGRLVPATIGNSCTSDDCGGLTLRRWLPGQSATDANGRLYVPYQAEGGAYGSGGRVRIFSAQGDSVNAIGGLSGPLSVAVGPDGSIYVAESYSHIVRRIRADSTRVVVAGTSGVSGFAGDGGLATAARLNNPVGIAVGPDGSLFIADQGNHRVRRVAPDGTISTYAGTGATTFVADGGRATTTPFPYPNTVTLGPDGSLYVGMAESLAGALISLLRRVDASGIVSTFAGYSSGAGPGPTAARQLAVASFSQVVIAPDGAPLFAAVLPGGGSISAPSGVWSATLNGDLVRVVGTGTPRCIVLSQAYVCLVGAPQEQNGDLAGRTFLEGLRGLAVGPDGSVFLSESWQTGGSNTSFIRAIRPAAPGLAATTMLVASPDGREVYEFTSTGKHMRTRDALSGRTLLVFDYDGAGRLVAARDSLGNTTTIERNTQGVPTAVVAPFGQRTVLTLDANRYLQEVRDPAGNRVQLTHGTTGLLTQLKDPRDKVHTFTYDADGRLLSDTDPATGVTTLRRVVRDTGYSVVDSSALNRKTTYTVDYLPDGTESRTVTDPSGFVSRSWRTVSASDSTRAPDSTRTLRIEASDPRFGSQAPYLRSLLVRLPSGDTSLVTGRRSTIRSDSTNPFAVTRDSSLVTVNGQTFTTVTLPTGTSFLSTTTSPLARQAAVRTDSLGRVRMARTIGLDSTWYQYDARGRLQRVQRGGRPVQYGYDTPLGRLAAITDPLSRIDSLNYDPADRLTRYRYSDGRAVLFAYDSSGNLTSVTPPGQPAHTFSYSPIDLRATYAPPSVGTGTWSTTYTYNRDRQLTQIDRPTGDAITLAYDAGGRPSTVGFNRGSLGSGTLTLGYSPTSGSLTSLTAPGSATLTFAYDGALPKAVTWGGTVAGSVQLRYDGAFRVDTILVNTANPIGFVYDADGLLTKAGTLAIGRHAATGLWQRDTAGVVLRGYGYSAHGELAADTTFVSGSAVYRVGYARDSLGRITTKTETIQGTTITWGYTYDGANRLGQVRQNGTLVRTYGYDLNGNRLTLTTPSPLVSGTYDAQDRLTSYGAAGALTTYTYNRAGQLATATTGGQTTTYTSDALGNLLQVQRPGALPLIQYVVDGQNRRIGKKVGGTLTTGWLYQSQLAPIAELNGSGAVVSRFIYASRPNVPDLMIRGGVTYRLVTDHLGSVRLVINTSTNTVVQRTDYDEFGQLTNDVTSGGFVPVPFGFAGGLLDRETGLTRFGARDYDPRIGRWTAKDPLVFTGQLANLYAYGSEPVNEVDPTGHIPILIISGFIGGTIAALPSLAQGNYSAAAGAFTVGFVAGVGGGYLASFVAAGWGASAVAEVGALLGGGFLGGASGNVIGNLWVGNAVDPLSVLASGVAGSAGTLLYGLVPFPMAATTAAWLEATIPGVASGFLELLFDFFRGRWHQSRAVVGPYCPVSR